MTPDAPQTVPEAKRTDRPRGPSSLNLVSAAPRSGSHRARVGPVHGPHGPRTLVQEPTFVTAVVHGPAGMTSSAVDSTIQALFTLTMTA